MALALRRCSSCGEDNPARAKFCLECGSKLSVESAPIVEVPEAPPDIVDQLPQQASGAGERRVVSVLFADLSGFTSYSERSDVEDVRALAQETAARLGKIVETYGGHVDKIIGDCVMAVFGAPTTHEDDPVRALRAALDMQDLVASESEHFAGLALSVGVNTGEAMWAPVGSDGRYTVLGDTVNTAARLQGAAAKGEVLVGKPTQRATSNVIDLEPVEPIKAKNKAEPVLAWRAVGVKGGAVQRKSRTRKLAGRDAELHRLRELWETVRTERKPYMVTLLGSAGVGKTRLVEELTENIGSGALVLRGKCPPYGEGITYWPIIEIIKQAAGILHDDDQETVSNKLGALLESYGIDDLDELRTMAVAVANLIGAPTTPRGTYTATEISRGELHWGLRRILELGARFIPIVIVLEDLHWAEPALLELVAYVLESRADAPILGIGTGRPEFRETEAKVLEPEPNHRVLELDALSDEASLDVIRQLAGKVELSDETARKLLDAAGGNPLFLEEIIQTWVDAGADPDHLAALEVPSGLRALISTRLDGLPPEERRALSHAAVIGEVFWTGALNTIGWDDELERLLIALEERDLVRTHETTTLTGQREYSFKHGLIREVAYLRMPKSERAVLHERCGTWISSIGPEEFVEIIAYHLEEACKLAAELSQIDLDPPVLAAVKALSRAGEKSEAREGTAEASRFYDRAITLIGERYPETLTELKAKRAYADVALGDFERAYNDLAEVARAALEASRSDIRSRALVSLVEVAIALGRVREARLHLDEAIEAAKAADDRSHAVRVGIVGAILRKTVEGSVEEAERDLLGAVELAEELDDHDLLISAELYLGTFAFNAGHLPRAEQAFRRVAALATERGSLQAQATATGFLAAVLYHTGPREESEELARRAAQWLERLGDRHLWSQALRLQGKLAIERDEPAAAQELFTRALEIVPRHGLLLAGLHRLVAEARAWQGRAIGARAAAAAAAEAAASQDGYASAFAAIADGCAGAAEGVPDAASEGFERGLGLFEQLNMATDLADARITYARALKRLGDFAAARDQLALARKTYEHIGARASVAHADRLASELE